MTTWTEIPNSDIDPESPLTASLVTALRDNARAVTEGASGAPKIESAALTDYPWGWEDFKTVAAGSYIFARQTDKTSGRTNTTYVKACEIKVPFPAIVTTRMWIIGKAVGSENMVGRVYLNGVATGVEHNSVTGAWFNENITVSAGDLVQLYVRMQSAVASDGTPKFAVMTDGAMVGGELYTLNSDWI